MNAKEKAKDLIYKFSCKVAGHSAVKQCAKIAVEEIIKSNPYYFYPNRIVTRISDHSTKEYWNEVKKEIDLL